MLSVYLPSCSAFAEFREGLVEGESVETKGHGPADYQTLIHRHVQVLTQHSPPTNTTQNRSTNTDMVLQCKYASDSLARLLDMCLLLIAYCCCLVDLVCGSLREDRLSGAVRPRCRPANATLSGRGSKHEVMNDMKWEECTCPTPSRVTCH